MKSQKGKIIIKNKQNMEKHKENEKIKECPKRQKDCANCTILNCPEEKA